MMISACRRTTLRMGLWLEAAAVVVVVVHLSVGVEMTEFLYRSSCLRSKGFISSLLMFVFFFSCAFLVVASIGTVFRF